MTLEKVNITILAVAALVAAASFASCSGSDGPEPPVIESDVPISVIGSSKTTLDTPTTPAQGYTPLQDHYTDFAVVAWKIVDGGRQDVIRRADRSGYQTAYFPAEQAEYDSRWRYDFTLNGVTQYLRYWDKTATEYTFSAYAPFSLSGALTGSQVDASEVYNVGFNEAGDVVIPGVVANSQTTPDWLVARHRRTVNPLADEDLLADASHQPLPPEKLTSDVPLVFHHILSSIEFRAFTDDGIPVTLTGISITLVPAVEGDTDNTIADTGDYSASGWTPTNFTSTIVDIPTYPTPPAPVVIDGNSRETSTLLPGTNRFEIPQSVAGKKLRVVLKSATRTYVGVFTLDSGWSAETHYIYYLRLSGSTVILVEIDIEKYHWREGNDIIIPDPVTNW